MRIFVTGASGWIGSAVVPELIDAGHTVVGLARSGEGAEKVRATGADVVRGTLADLDLLRGAAAESDGVVHLGYIHDFSQMADAAQTDRTVIDLFGDVLAGSGRPLLIASGVAGLTPGRVATEADQPDPNGHPRGANAIAAQRLADRGVRSVIARFAPTVHGAGDKGFIARLVEVARDKGVSGYVEDGTNRWAAVHRFDAAPLVRTAFESAPTGTVVHAVAEPGVTTRDIAEAIGSGLGVPVESVPADKAAEHFGWIGMFFGMDLQASSTVTREAFDWTPSHPTLLEDLATDSYFAA